MNTGLMLVSVALGAALLAGCDRTKDADSQSTTAAPTVAAQALPPQAQPLPPQIPSPAAASTTGNNANTPIQGQIDVKEPAQRRSFETTK